MKMNDMSLDEALQLREDIDKSNRQRIMWWIYNAVMFFITICTLNSETWLFAMIVAIIWITSIVLKNKKHPLEVRVWFGLPGSGKTTMCAALVKKAHKKGIPSYTNVPITGAFKIDPKKDLGFADIRNAQVIIDEAGITYNNRDIRAMSKETIEWLKLHRHYKCSVDVFSQSYDDMDITLRRLAYHYYLVRRFIIPGVFVAYPIRRSIGINDMTKEICDTYSLDSPLIRLFTAKYYVGRKYWHMFDSYDAPELPHKTFDRWTEEECGVTIRAVMTDILPFTARISASSPLRITRLSSLRSISRSFFR